MAYAIVAVLILIIDQAVKYWTTVNLAIGETAPLIPGFIELTNIHNTGAAHGILEGFRWLFIPLTLIFAVAVIVMLSKNVIKGKFGRWTIVMVMAGGLGNCIDRIINGYVVDMLNFEFVNYYVFNVADMFISVCGVLFCLYVIFHKNPKEEEDEPDPSVPETHERPVKGPDYIAQIQKPVVDAKLELSTPNQESGDDEIKDTDYFKELNSSKKVQPSKTTKKARISAHTVRSANSKGEPEKGKPEGSRSQPEKKGKCDEFSLESILAEFKDK